MAAMKLYLILRTDRPDYGQTNKLVVRATDVEHAKEIALAPADVSENYDPHDVICSGELWGEDCLCERMYPGLTPDNIVVAELTADGPAGEVIEDNVGD